MCCRRLEALGTTTESSLSWCLQSSSAKSHICTFWRSGAVHHARWMTKALYAVKIVLLKSQFQLTQSQEKVLRELVLFACSCYARAGFESFCADVAVNDSPFSVTSPRIAPSTLLSRTLSSGPSDCTWGIWERTSPYCRSSAKSCPGPEDECRGEAGEGEAWAEEMDGSLRHQRHPASPNRVYQTSRDAGVAEAVDILPCCVRQPEGERRFVQRARALVQYLSLLGDWTF